MKVYVWHYNWLIVILLLFIYDCCYNYDAIHWNFLGDKVEFTPEVHYEIPREAAGNYEIPVASGTVSFIVRYISTVSFIVRYILILTLYLLLCL